MPGFVLAVAHVVILFHPHNNLRRSLPSPPFADEEIEIQGLHYLWVTGPDPPLLPAAFVQC